MADDTQGKAPSPNLSDDGGVPPEAGGRISPGTGEAMTPTHLYCQRHDTTFPVAEYRQHCEDHHDGRDISVIPRSLRCRHGNPISDGFMFCCDYEP